MFLELKHIEFFIACVEHGSLSKAAESLYTSQPNVSKIIKEFENELGKLLFVRSAKGLRLTDYGKSIYDHAKNVVHNVNLITEHDITQKDTTFKVSSYQSHVISRLLLRLYQEDETLKIKHYQGTVEEIITNVSQGFSDIGILYVSKKQINSFRHIISHKNLEFVEMAKRRACLFIGKNNPYYEYDEIPSSKLSEFSFISGLNNFFSIEHHFEEINLGPFANQQLKSVIHTNSEYLSADILGNTDLAALGIDVCPPIYMQPGGKVLYFEGDDSNLILGYVKEKDHHLSDTSYKLIEYINELLEI